MVGNVREISLGEGFGDVALKVNGVRVEIHADGSIDVQAGGNVDVHTNAPVRVHPPESGPAALYERFDDPRL